MFLCLKNLLLCYSVFKHYSVFISPRCTAQYHTDFSVGLYSQFPLPARLLRARGERSLPVHTGKGADTPAAVRCERCRASSVYAAPPSRCGSRGTPSEVYQAGHGTPRNPAYSGHDPPAVLQSAGDCLQLLSACRTSACLASAFAFARCHRHVKNPPAPPPSSNPKIPMIESNVISIIYVLMFLCLKYMFICYSVYVMFLCLTRFPCHPRR